MKTEDSLLFVCRISDKKGEPDVICIRKKILFLEHLPMPYDIEMLKRMSPASLQTHKRVTVSLSICVDARHQTVTRENISNTPTMSSSLRFTSP